MTLIFSGALWVAAALGAPAATQTSHSSKDALKIESASRAQTVELKDLQAKLKLHELTVDDPVYKKKKTYEGFLVADVLEQAGLSATQGDEIVFHCADGYSPEIPLSRLTEKKGLLAIREKGRKDRFELVKQGKARLSPAPFYLVWETAESAFPWPYQVVGIEIVDFKKKFDRIYPEGVEPGASVAKGFDLFKGRCLKCHSLNLQGGVLGPELNVPKNITEYWDEKVMLSFIKNSGEFRANSKMPPNPDLNDAQMGDLLAYLKWMKDHKK